MSDVADEMRTEQPEAEKRDIKQKTRIAAAGKNRFTMWFSIC